MTTTAEVCLTVDDGIHWRLCEIGESKSAYCSCRVKRRFKERFIEYESGVNHAMALTVSRCQGT